MKPKSRKPGGGSLLNPEGLTRDVIVIGASAGGVEALMRLFSMLPADLPALIGCVLHRGAVPGQLAAVLGRRSSLPVVEPGSGDETRRGIIYLAPADHHLLFVKGRAESRRAPREHSTRPAIDPLFRSAAAAYGKRVVGAVLTGCGEDGVSGMIAIRNAHGLAVVQDPAEAYMPYMPLNALRFDHVAGVFSLEQLASVLASLARGDRVQAQASASRTA
jgi:two-component system chemotaxis response regulator CheB